MKKYIEVACTYYKTLLIAVEYDDFHTEDEIIDVARITAEGEGDPDDIEIVGMFDKKPEGTNMAMYDEYVETFA